MTEKPVNQLLDEDARGLLRFVQQNSVDVTVTSPPYYDLKDYQDSRQIGHGQDFAGYKSDLTRIFADVFKATKDTGSLWVIVDNMRIDGKLLLLPFEMAEWIRGAGWILQDVLVWDKVKTRPVIRGLGVRKVYESILVFSKTKNFKHHLDKIRDYELTRWWVKWPERYKSSGKLPSDIWSFLIPSQGNWSRWPIFKHQKLHECPFPPELVERILLLTTDPGDMVLDPFAGSGMTLAVANCMQLKFTGFEVNQAYLKSFWSQVVPSVKNWYQEKHAQMVLSDDEMERRLDKLKKLKFARTLSRKLIDNVPALRLASTFLLDKNDMVDVFLIYDEGRSQANDELQTTAGEEAERLLTKSELKTFHVKAISHVLPVNEFIEAMRDSLGSTDLWLYKRHHLYESSIRFDDWIAKHADETWRESYSMGKSPPMVSNIDIYQKEVDLRKLPADE
jgi:DNA modification methylase